MEKQKALNKCMDMCSRREYCANDILEKLEKWELENEDCHEIIELLFKDNYMNHHRYANAFVNDKIKFNHWGKNKVKYYLSHKRVENDIVSAALNAFNEGEYYEIAESEIQKKLQKTNAKDKFELKNKVAKSIINKGFESELVFKILAAILQ